MPHTAIFSNYVVLNQDVIPSDSDIVASDSLTQIRSSFVYFGKDSTAMNEKQTFNPDSVLIQQVNFQVPDSASLAIDRPYGFDGIISGVRLENSVGIQSVLLLSVILTTIAIGLGYKQFDQIFRGLFQARDRSSFFVDNSVVGLGFKAILTIQAILLEALVGYIIVKDAIYHDILQSNFVIIMVLFALLFIFYHLFRIFSIAVLGLIFSEHRTLKSYLSEYFDLLSVWGISLFPISFVLIFWHFSPVVIMVLLAGIIIFVRILYFGKGIKVFFIQSRNIFYIILYLCALEILPLIALYQALVYIYFISQ
ncbi:MAG: DUF4271 domain-containing protein [Bacteroidales bacterium]|nr:DUF4271 domain-containing protein [Bacteroidales bacterium]